MIVTEHLIQTYKKAPKESTLMGLNSIIDLRNVIQTQPGYVRIVHVAEILPLQVSPSTYSQQ